MPGGSPKPAFNIQRTSPPQQNAPLAFRLGLWQEGEAGLRRMLKCVGVRSAHPTAVGRHTFGVLLSVAAPVENGRIGVRQPARERRAMGRR